MSLPTLSGEFTVASDPELRFTPSGKAVADVLLVANSRTKNDQGEWVDDKTLWMRGSAWGQVAENIAESCEKGSKVSVIGRVVTDEWKDKDSGEKKSKTALLIDSIGLALRFDPAKSVKTERKEGETQQAQPSQQNPWKGEAASDEPPF